MTLIIMPIFYFLVGRSILRLWKAGLIGVALMLMVDYAGFRFNLYQYQNGIITLGNWMPVLHIVNCYLVAMMYINWLPGQWGRRILYTVCFSVFTLVIEVMVFSWGGIIYPNWRIWYSYFLCIVGLSLLGYLSDFVLKKPGPAGP